MSENHLIERLPRLDRERLLAVCRPVHLVLADVLCEAGARTRYVYFPTHGFISLITPPERHAALAVGMVGREGMVGSELALGVARAPLQALVQGAGASWRIEAARFRAELSRSEALRRIMNRYLYVLMSQLATSAACLRFHRIGPRLARWLLMTRDRAHADTFPVTQDCLASLLGVRRVGVTTAAGALQRDGLIAYRRGRVTVVDRRGLESVACHCYATDRRTHARLL